MRIIIAVDANILLSALLGGKPSIILFDSRFLFVTTEFTVQEVKKYIPRLAEKLKVPEKDILDLLELLPISMYQRDFYTATLHSAKRLIGHIDAKDADILALALKLNVYLWSQDKDFEKCGYDKILKTHQFLE